MFTLLDHALLRVHARIVRRMSIDRERGDVPGWVLITIMTAGLVIAIWAVAEPLLEDTFRKAVKGVKGP